jgi:uncharacterized protein (DUF983 family)
MRILGVYWRALLLRCPRCGVGRLFRGWWTMAPRCPVCELSFERDPGFYLGSIYVNYGLTAVLVLVIYFSLFFTGKISENVILGVTLAVAVLFPIWFFRYARSIWLGFDYYWDPQAHNDAPPDERKQD